MSGFDRRSFLKASVATAAASALAGCAANAGSSALAPKSSGRSVMGLVVPKMAEVRVGLIASVSEVLGLFTISTT